MGLPRVSTTVRDETRAGGGGGDGDDEGEGRGGGEDVVVEREPRVARPRPWCVVFYNDDYTTKWFVVHVLEQFFRMNETNATALMLAVHRHGKGVAGVYTRDIAETKAAEVTDYARDNGMPLKVIAEPDEDDDGS